MAATESLTSGSFTLPGEAGYEALTLRLAKKWGADTIRDSDGTQLSPEITRPVTTSTRRSASCAPSSRGRASTTTSSSRIS
jgi:hypothetical protein